MFTGLIEETGDVLAMHRLAQGEAGEGHAGARGGVELVIRAPRIAADVAIGDSIAVNGCCLTVSRRSGDALHFHLLEETLRRTNLGALEPRDDDDENDNAHRRHHRHSRVNLERALAAVGRLGGHFVQGHIDCTAPVQSFDRVGADHRLEIALPAEFARYVAFKGSVAVNGISLTVAEVREDAGSLVIWIIPHTLAVTNLRDVQPGDALNLEFDLLAKYVERILQKS